MRRPKRARLKNWIPLGFTLAGVGAILFLSGSLFGFMGFLKILADSPAPSASREALIAQLQKESNPSKSADSNSLTSAISQVLSANGKRDGNRLNRMKFPNLERGTASLPNKPSKLDQDLKMIPELEPGQEGFDARLNAKRILDMGSEVFQNQTDFRAVRQKILSAAVDLQKYSIDHHQNANVYSEEVRALAGMILTTENPSPEPPNELVNAYEIYLTTAPDAKVARDQTMEFLSHQKDPTVQNILIQQLSNAFPDQQEQLKEELRLRGLELPSVMPLSPATTPP